MSVLGESQTMDAKYTSYFETVEIIINNVKYIMTSEYPKYLRGTKNKPGQGNPYPFANLNSYFEI